MCAGCWACRTRSERGFNRVRVRMRVESTADAETLKELALFSPVHDIVSKSLPVEFVLEKDLSVDTAMKWGRTAMFEMRGSTRVLRENLKRSADI